MTTSRTPAPAAVCGSIRTVPAPEMLRLKVMLPSSRLSFSVAPAATLTPLVPVSTTLPVASWSSSNVPALTVVAPT